MLQLSFVNFKPNSYLLVEGTPVSDRFFIIQKGEAMSFHETQIPGIPVSTFGAGDFVGVVSCMSGHSQSESVIAKTDVVAISVKRDQYTELIRKNTPVALKIVRAFAREMRMLNDNLTKLTLNKTVEETPEMLYTIASYYEKSSLEMAAAYGYYQYIKTCPNGVNIDAAKRHFVMLQKRVKPVYLESGPELVRDYPKAAMIFSECQAGNDMFIIQEGSVRISKVVGGQEVTLALLKKGDMFGEMALLENKPRSANAIAHEDCKLMVVNHSNFDQMVSTRPEYISRLTTTLADRLWSMYRQLANAQLTDLRARMVDMLALQIEKLKVAPVPGQPFHTNLTPLDLIKFCGITDRDKPEAIYQMEHTRNIKIEAGVIIVPDVNDLIKQAAFDRKQDAKAKKEQKS